MLITVDNKLYNLFTSQTEGIRIINHQSSEIPNVYAHPNHSMDEVLTYIQKFQLEKSNSSKTYDDELEFTKIELFGKTFSVKIKRNVHFSPYFKNDMIICSAPQKADIHQIKFINSLASSLFQQTVINIVANWEEKINILTNGIYFKSLRKRAFNVIAETKDITFNKKIRNLTLSHIDFLVFLSIISLYPSIQQDMLIKKHFPNAAILANQIIAMGYDF